MKDIEKQINIKLTASQSAEVDNEIENDEYNAFVVGTISKRNNMIFLKFKENLNESDEVETELCFDINNTSVVSLNRKGILPTNFIFEKNARQIGHYTLFGMVAQICIDTHKLENTLTMDGGEIYMEYNIEFRGNVTQTNKMHIICTL